LTSRCACPTIVTSLLIFLLGGMVSYTAIYLLLGCLVTVAGLWALFQDPTHDRIAVQHRKMIFRRRYLLY